ncbi:hypothetical protein ON010_g11724 [Phytophthora cinnamomi]|nr:hypothetical protein ON010_g11724 [Phytophthora cinnamomi]
MTPTGGYPPVRWDSEVWTFYKHAILNAFEKILLNGITTGSETEDASWDDEKKGDFKKKQTKIKIIIQGSLSMRLAKQVMAKPTGTEMWRELMDFYEGKSNPAMTAQKVYCLRYKLHKTNLRGKDDVRSHLYKLFDIKNRLADLGSPVNDLQMVDRMLRSLPALPCYNELRRKVLFSSSMGKYTPDLWLFPLGRNRPLQARRAGLGENTSGRTAQAKYAQNTPKSKPLQSTNEGEGHAGKRDVVIGEAVKRALKDYDPTRWYFDTGTNAHITARAEYFTILQSKEDSDWNPTISGFAYGADTKAEGFGTIMLAAMIDEEIVFMLVEDVLFTSTSERYLNILDAAEHLFSPGLALDQGFTMMWDSEARIFGMAKENTEVIRTEFENRLWTFNAQNGMVSRTSMCGMNVWDIHAPNTVDGRPWNGEGHHAQSPRETDCVGCHFGKQLRKTFRKSLDRPLEKVNDMVSADLPIRGASNGSSYAAEYIAWAERQHGVNGAEVITRITRNWSNDEEDESGGDLHHIRAFGSLAFCHTLMSKREKLAMHCKMIFLLGYHEDVVGCHVYFPTECKKGFVSDVEINEAIKYKARFKRGYRTKVNRWLQTFNEFIEEDEFDDFTNDDDDDSSQQVECGVDSECGEATNVEMEDVESVDGSNDYDRTNVWQERLRSRPPQSSVSGNSLSNVQSEHENSQSGKSANR